MRARLLVTTALALAATPSVAQTRSPGAEAQASRQPADQQAETIPSPSADAADGQAAAGQTLGDIVVTAQRRSENLQRAAVAVDAVSGADLVAAGATQIARLNEQVPALTVQPSGNGNLIFVRGVGNFTVTPNSDPATAFNVDGVYVGRATNTVGVFFDLDRVEVLKGPQGTLYGRNATGGAVNVIPTQPMLGELSGYVNASYGNYDAVILEGAVNAPMGENGAIRLSGSYANHDGWLRSGTSDEDTFAVRLQMKARLTPSLTVRLLGSYAEVNGVGEGINYVGSYRFNPTTRAYAFTASGLPFSEGIFTPAAQAYRQTQFAGPAGRRLDAFAIDQFQDNRHYAFNTQIDWDTGFGTLTVVPAWRYSKLNYLSSALAFAFRQNEEDEQFSLEARFAGNRIGPIDYTLGAFYYHETIDAFQRASVSATFSILDQNYRTESIAPFARLTAHLTEQLRLVGGVRYTRDDKTFTGTTVAGTVACLVRVNGVPNCPNAPLFPLVDNVSQIPFAFPRQGGGPVPLLVGGVPTGAVALRNDRLDDSGLVDKKVTWRGAVEFDLAPQSLLYGSVETGFRSGGFSAAQGFETYAPETITAYTIGSKNRFFGNRVQLNLEAFWWDYRDQQISALRTDLAGRAALIVQNVGSARIRGLEAETRVLATRTTLLSADVQYLDTRNKGFVYFQANTGAPPIVGCANALDPALNLYRVDCSGKDAFNSPKWTLNLAAQQTINLGDYKLVVGADTQFRSSRVIGFSYLPEQTIGSNWRSNAQVAFSGRDERWTIAAFVRNIERDRVPNYADLNPITGTLINGVSSPRLYGVRGSFSF